MLWHEKKEHGMHLIRFGGIFMEKRVQRGDAQVVLWHGEGEEGLGAEVRAVAA
jgi:hypothetical protein